MEELINKDFNIAIIRPNILRGKTFVTQQYIGKEMDSIFFR